MDLTTLAHYRIIRPLGQGGMGEVYLAEDTKLGRQVAIKALPERLAGDASQRERLALEARGNWDRASSAGVAALGGLTASAKATAVRGSFTRTWKPADCCGTRVRDDTYLAM